VFPGDYSSAKLAERMEEQNEKILGRWKEEVDSVVVFVCATSTLLSSFLLKHVFKAGLFTAIGAVFLTGSYKGSAQNPGKETVNLKLIAELFQHLVNISDGIPLRVESVAAERSEPFKQTRSEVMVNLNVTWFFSIIICIGCTAFVTSIQRWARRRVAHIQRGGSPYELARLQAFLFRKPGRFLVRMHRLYLLLGIFMRLSLLFYCVGLVAFIFRIDQKSISKALALGYILGCFLVYAMTMVLPFYFFDCPYGTPFTVLTWRLYHAFMFGFFSTFRGITDLPHSLSTLGSLTHRRVRDPSQWRKMLEERVNKHRRRLSCGRERRVESHPTKALRVMETWATEKSSDKAQKEVEDFTAWALEFFNSYALLGAEETILPLVSDQSPTNCIFGIRLRHLLAAFTLGCFDPTTDSEVRRRCLRDCLECLWCSAKAYSQKTAASLPSLVPFPNTNTIHRLQAERDPTVAIMARCFCALIARELAADINSRSSSDYTKLESLSAILGRTRMEVEVLLLQPGAICLTNVVSLVSGVIKVFSTEEVPPNVMSIFRTTSDILLAEDTLISPDVELPQDLVSSFYQTYSNAQQLQAPDWLMRQLYQISERLIAVSEERERQGGGHSIFLGQD
jgi:hypothetical protein